MNRLVRFSLHAPAHSPYSTHGEPWTYIQGRDLRDSTELLYHALTGCRLLPRCPFEKNSKLFLQYKGEINFKISIYQTVANKDYFH